MTIANLAEVLRPAILGNFAVAGLVVLGWEDAKAYVEAAESLQLPVILQAGPGCRRHTPVPVLGKMFRYLAEQASVPVVCHIDHATSVEECQEGIDSGFSSIMIDGSKLPLAENIALTQRVVSLCRPHEISVEGEVGIVGYNEGAASAFTSPADAAHFEKQTGVDALAIAIGNLHLQTEKQAAIDMQVLRAIEAVTTVPLVLHGSSGIPSNIRQVLARESRVKKFNIGTELRMAFGRGLRTILTNQPHEFDRISILRATIPFSRAIAASVMQEISNIKVNDSPAVQ
jgi:fructose-bisphosphate aldolase class II